MAKKQQADPVTPEMRKGAHGVYPTVTVKGENGPMRINEHDYDEEEHGAKMPDRSSPGGGAARKKAGKAELEGMTKEELMKELDNQGVEYPSHATKDELVKLAQKGA